MGSVCVGSREPLFVRRTTLMATPAGAPRAGADASTAPAHEKLRDTWVASREALAIVRPESDALRELDDAANQQRIKNAGKTIFASRQSLDDFGKKLDEFKRRGGKVRAVWARRGPERARRSSLDPRPRSVRPRVPQLVVAPPEAQVDEKMHEFQVHVRPRDTLLPACHVGENRSQVLFALLQDVADVVNRRVAASCVSAAEEERARRRLVRVGLPHGAESGFDPVTISERDDDLVVDYILTILLPFDATSGGPVREAEEARGQGNGWGERGGRSDGRCVCSEGRDKEGQERQRWPDRVGVSTRRASARSCASLASPRSRGPGIPSVRLAACA